MAGTRRQGIEHSVDEDCTERSATIAFGQSGVGTMIQFVRDAAYPDTLSGVAEGFGTGDKQNIVVGVMCYGRLVGRLEGVPKS